MPFLDSVDSIQAKAHVSGVSNPALIGILVVVGLALCLFVFNLVSSASGVRFQLEEDSSLIKEETKRGEGLNLEEGRADSRNTLSPNSREDLSNESRADEEAAHPSVVVVFVSGCVKNPGVYELQEGSRVGDAIEAAGGFASDAASDYNNLARPVVDAEQIHVPSLKDAPNQVQDAASFPQPASDTDHLSQDSSLININTATASELEALPGIGPATAEKIVSNREAEGPFASVEDLMRVSGIGEKKYTSLEGLICV